MPVLILFLLHIDTNIKRIVDKKANQRRPAGKGKGPKKPGKPLPRKLGNGKDDAASNSGVDENNGMEWSFDVNDEDDQSTQDSKSQVNDKEEVLSDEEEEEQSNFESEQSSEESESEGEESTSEEEKSESEEEDGSEEEESESEEEEEEQRSAGVESEEEIVSEVEAETVSEHEEEDEEEEDEDEFEEETVAEEEDDFEEETVAEEGDDFEMVGGFRTEEEQMRSNVEKCKAEILKLSKSKRDGKARQEDQDFIDEQIRRLRALIKEGYAQLPENGGKRGEDDARKPKSKNSNKSKRSLKDRESPDKYSQATAAEGTTAIVAYDGDNEDDGTAEPWTKYHRTETIHGEPNQGDY